MKHIVTHPGTLWNEHGHTLASFQVNPESGYIEALMLSSIDHIPTIEHGFNDKQDYRDVIWPLWNIDFQMIDEVTPEVFNTEVNRRQTHTPEMLEMLLHNYTLADLTSYMVYGSLIHPMSSSWARIEDAVYFDSSKAESGYHTYVAVPALLDAETVRHYSFVFISHP